jgi:hypothetical protein
LDFENPKSWQKMKTIKLKSCVFKVPKGRKRVILMNAATPNDSGLYNDGVITVLAI